eukprot:TRINITY_DN12959_c0_g1_i1.p1 TRINITY_DN12959_c0_g1~~TRINITY_DN12959_c0_g1_i1.p1  ORF type:complete len:644 (-),score=135.30 TRINITY_DN12959_c0_g1_i1:10-1941(-)
MMDNKAGLVILLVVSLILLSSASCADAKRFDRHYRLNLQTGVFERDLRSVTQEAPRGYLDIASVLESRFATTTLSLNIKNVESTDQELPFIVDVPLTAFISYFSLEVNGKLYEGTVVEKSEAEQIYEDAKNQNKTAGIVEGGTGSPTTQTFAMSANVGAGLTAKFTLIYKMLLTRKLSRYEYLLYIPTNIASLSIDATVFEPSGLYSLQSPSHNNDLAIVANNTWGHVTYGVDTTASPLNGPVVLRYEVGAMPNAGNLLVNDNYFVHFFSPSNLPTIPKSVVLIIDTSGSMEGNKIQQARNAASTFVSWLSSEDKFNIISFSTGVRLWQSNPVVASDNNKNQGKQFISDLTAAGSTNINDALLQALNSINNGYSDSYLPIIVFLTDGQATAGETIGTNIRANVRNANVNRASIFCLGFGYSLDYELLRSIAAENNGLDRRIIDDSSAQSQLESFFAEVNKPIMSSVLIEYKPEDSTTNVTQNAFKYLFEGSEIIVTGRIASEVTALDVYVTGSTKNGPVEYTQNVPVSNTTQLNTQVIWAYWTIQELIAQYDIQNSLENSVEANSARDRATQLALEYQFVTRFTSMIVVANDTTSENLPPITSKPFTNPPGVLYSNTSAAGQYEPMWFMAALSISFALIWSTM